MGRRIVARVPAGCALLTVPLEIAVMAPAATTGSKGGCSYDE
jgi:hypothetical protein